MSLLGGFTGLFRARKVSVKEESTAYMRKYAAAPEALAAHVALEPKEDSAFSKRGNVYFTSSRGLADVLEALQVTQMAAIVRARMSATTFQRLRPVGLNDVALYDRFMPPGRVELLLNDGARVWVQVSLEDLP